MAETDFTFKTHEFKNKKALPRESVFLLLLAGCTDSILRQTPEQKFRKTQNQIGITGREVSI